MEEKNTLHVQSRRVGEYKHLFSYFSHQTWLCLMESLFLFHCIQSLVCFVPKITKTSETVCKEVSLKQLRRAVRAAGHTACGAARCLYGSCCDCVSLCCGPWTDASLWSATCSGGFYRRGGDTRGTTSGPEWENIGGTRTSSARPPGSEERTWWSQTFASTSRPESRRVWEEAKRRPDDRPDAAEEARRASALQTDQISLTFNIFSSGNVLGNNHLFSFSRLCFKGSVCWSFLLISKSHV